jgi:SAM-dependent methyltransferase
LALAQHLDDKVRFDQQVENSKSYVLPFIEATHAITGATTVMEIGTGEGGVLLPFIERGCFCVGVDLVQLRIDLANNFLAKEIADKKVKFICQNILEESFLNVYKNYFDIIILKDVIEHVYNQEQFIPYLKKLLKPGGQIFFGFPPWYMPFGGHQQVCTSKWASMLPYYHILPRFLYVAMLKMAKEHPLTIKELLEVKDTQITIERFERIIKKSGLEVLKKNHYLINPIYKYKFKLQPRLQWTPITWLPYIRDFLTTCVYYTVGVKQQ